MWCSRATDPRAHQGELLRDQVEGLIRSHLGGHNPTDPAASPLYGDLAGHLDAATQALAAIGAFLSQQIAAAQSA